MSADSPAIAYRPIRKLFRAANDRYAYAGDSVLHGANLSTVVFNGAGGGLAGFVSMNQRTWFMNAFKQQWMAGVTTGQMGISAPSSAPSVGIPYGAGPGSGVLNSGDSGFQYYVTYSNVYGDESAPSPISDPIIAINQPVLVGLPASPDSQVIYWNIYRIGAGVNSPLRVAQVYGASSFYDNVSVSQQQTDFIEMPLDNDMPPAAYGLAGPFLGRLIAFRSIVQPGRYWWSKPGQPHAWPGALDDFEGNWEDAGDVREAILAATHAGRMLRLYKEKGIWRVDGDPDTNDVERTNADVGLVGPDAIASRGAVDYFLGPEGIYAFNGDRTELISHRIAPIFKGEYTRVGDVYVPPINIVAASLSVMAQRFGRLYFSYPSITSEPDTTLVCDLDSGRWYTHKLSDSLPATGFAGLYDEGTTSVLLGSVSGASTSTLYRLEEGNRDGTAAIPLIWQSRQADQGLPDNEKVYQDLVIDYQTADANESASSLTVKVIYKNQFVDNVVEPVGTIQSGDRVRKTFSLGGYPGLMAYNLAVRIEGDVTSTVRIYEATLHYYVEPRRSRHWDSGWLDLGTRNFKELLALEFDIESDDAVDLGIHNDDVFFNQAAANTITASTIRRRVYLQNETQPPTLYNASQKGINGRKFRFTLAVNEGKYFKLYGARVKVRPLGTLIDGDTKEFWVPTPLSPGN